MRSCRRSSIDQQCVSIPLMQCPSPSPNRSTTGRTVGKRAKNETTGTNSTRYGEALNSFFVFYSRSALLRSRKIINYSIVEMGKINFKFLVITEIELVDGSRSKHFQVIGQRTLTGG